MKKHLLITLIAVSCAVATSAFAAEKPKESPADPRIKSVVYRERDVVTIKGHYGYSTTLEFAEHETVETASIGDSVAWQVIKPESRPNMLFIKPLEANANTNMTVVTNLRIYSFELSADKAPSRQDKNLAFRIRFTYPNTDAQGLAGIGGDGQPSAGLLTQGKSPDEWNFDYSFSGSRSLRPERAFDDGKFTYLQFSRKLKTPAIFLVDEKGNESLVNFTRKGKYIVVERLGRKFTLRDGKDTVACVSNDAFPDAEKSETLANDEKDGGLKERDTAALFGDDVEYSYPTSKHR